MTTRDTHSSLVKRARALARMRWRQAMRQRAFRDAGSVPAAARRAFQSNPLPMCAMVGPREGGWLGTGWIAALHVDDPRASPRGLRARLSREGQDAREEALQGDGRQADTRLFRVVLENLIDNAVKFSPGQGICTIQVRGCDRGDEALIQVRDRGVGFPEELAPRLFRPFQRLHPRGQLTGTGIGPATVARIVQLHGSTISGRNRRGGGALFEIRIPRRMPCTLPAHVRSKDAA